ncbi:MAG: segregation/condensation protein A [Patescibacteria group bacterium]
MTFTIKQREFEGPLDLLLQLIEERELDITAVALAEVTDQYLGQVRTLSRENLSEISDYLVIAARLVVLKSRALLPVEDEEVPEADDLAQRLAEYKVYKELAGALGTRVEEAGRSIGRPPLSIEPPRKLVTDGVDLTGLHRAFRSVLAELPKPERLSEETLEEQVTIDECIGEIRRRLLEGPVGFRSFFKDVTGRVRMIVTFLAILELIKQEALTVRDDKGVTLCPA